MLTTHTGGRARARLTLRGAGGLALIILIILIIALGCTPPPPRATGHDDEAARLPVGHDGTLPGLAADPQLRAELDASLAAKGPDYQPRTHHLLADGRPKYTNRLIRETSPYLLQHAHNPVNWYPWGEEVFAQALRENKPVLLSIGYSTCHWCHVMERESFEDEQIAAYINENYLAIKVDREQRPDLDEVYMRAVQLLTGSGGWPMTVILTPAREPFFGGTYFPPKDHGKRPGFRSVLEQMKQAYDEQPDKVVARARALSQQIAEVSSGPVGDGDPLPPASSIAAAVASVGRTYDPRDGGFGAAPKFPRPANLEMLLRYAHRASDPQALAWARGTVDHIIAGGIRDHVGGGFHRYATDARWLTPHFEKMLYDNAQLVVILLELYQITADERYAEVARETLDYLNREMSAPTGGFYSATDADSLVPDTGHSEEGWFFTWTQGEIDGLLDPSTAAHVHAYYATSPGGNFEGRNILHTPRPLDDVAAELQLSPAALADSLAGARRQLYRARATRPPPLRDDKILSAWNGLAISAFARAALVLDAPRYLARARAGAEFLATQHIDDQGRLLRSSLGEQIGSRGYLDDYAFVIQADLDLFEASADLRWLEAAIALQAQQDAHHLDPKAGGYFTTADDAESLLSRQKPSYDGAEPSGNSVAALNLLRLHELRGDPSYKQHATQLLVGQTNTIERNPTGVPKLLCALDFLLDRPLQIFVVTPKNDPSPTELLKVIRHAFVPNHALAIVPEDQLSRYQTLIPALEQKLARNGQATAYVCEANLCRAPTSDPTELAAQLATVTPYVNQP